MCSKKQVGAPPTFKSFDATMGTVNNDHSGVTSRHKFSGPWNQVGMKTTPANHVENKLEVLCLFSY
jgi:hypothetical protein